MTLKCIFKVLKYQVLISALGRDQNIQLPACLLFIRLLKSICSKQSIAVNGQVLYFIICRSINVNYQIYQVILGILMPITK